MEASDPRAEAFKHAVYSGDATTVRELFTEHPDLSEVLEAPIFHFGSTALLQAAGARNRDLLDALLDLGADIHARSDWDAGPYSVLHRLVDGVNEKSLLIADHLVSRGAEIDLHAAAGMGRVDVIEEILDAEPDRVSEPGPDGATPLHLALNVEVAAVLLDYGAEIDKPCVDHNSTPVMWAAQNRPDVVRMLLDNGARPDLYLAALLGDRGLAEEILAEDPNAIHVRVIWGRSHEHVGHGDKYIWALDGAEIPVEVARRHEHEEVYRFLLERSPPEVQLTQASWRGDPEAVARVLDDHPDLLSTAEERHICQALHGDPDCVRVLLDRGADPMARDDGAGATALHHAGWRGLKELAIALLDGGADPYARDRDYGATPLGWANENGQTELMDLLTKRAPPDLVDAAWLGDTERVLELLAEHPDSVDGIDAGRVSPLRSAAWTGKVDVVRALLEHGANREIPNPSNGKTALDFAHERGHQEIIDLLSES